MEQEEELDGCICNVLEKFQLKKEQKTAAKSMLMHRDVLAFWGRFS